MNLPFFFLSLFGLSECSLNIFFEMKLIIFVYPVLLAGDVESMGWVVVGLFAATITYSVMYRPPGAVSLESASRRCRPIMYIVDVIWPLSRLQKWGFK